MFFLNIFLDEPSLPTLYYEDEHTWERMSTSSIQVIKHTPFTVKCDNALSNPLDVMYHWHGNIGNNLTIRDINRNDARDYTCTVTNVMKRTFKVIRRLVITQQHSLLMFFVSKLMLI